MLKNKYIVSVIGEVQIEYFGISMVFFDMSYRIGSITMIIGTELYKLHPPSIMASDYLINFTDF